VFAFRDDRDEIARIQVKTANAKPYKSGAGFSAKFGIPVIQIEATDNPPLFYVLAVRIPNGWGSFIVIERIRLQLLRAQGCGSANDKSGDLELHIQYRPEEDQESARCGVFDLSEYLNSWETLPPLKPDTTSSPSNKDPGVTHA